MPKQLNINLAFTSDTTKVKQDLQELQNILSRLTANSAQKSPLGITNEIKTAISDVAKLESALKKATTSTGSLDLGQFKTELNQAGLSAEKIATQLATLGPEGKRAFAQLTQSVMSAEIPLKQTSTLLSNFATTLKNTARWQISSSILHGFMGSIQGAYNYAQSLNKSLNNIRIVTGKSADEMADFAEQANEAAQALSTTTTEYTNASLIYYQQGLDDDAVKERTDATVKMANVTRESAEEVSQQMTAIWNNFDNGSKSLEYYSDVVTALGAATASSSAEIAQGLEKFASVADTVGLSYEYATAALATVTATTRQSADIVGNAFKTLFARMEGLKLGETLDDGTDLNKYSKALDAVGISIKNTDGDLKEMDQILDELGARWQTLAKDQQMALAQTVAGVRQYTQLVALMENYDFFQQNVRTAKNAEGTLQEQFEIYEQSWEAAKKRLSASMQDIYKSLIDESFFTKLTDGFAKIASSIAKVIESFGGIKGLLPGIGALILKVFGSDISGAMSRFAENITLGSQSSQKALLESRQQFANLLKDIQSDGSLAGTAMAEVYQKQGEAQNSLIQKVRELSAQNTTLSEQEQLHINKLMDYSNVLGEIKIKETERLETLQAETEQLNDQVISKARAYAKQDESFNLENFTTQLNGYKELQVALQRVSELKERYANVPIDEQGAEALEQIVIELDKIVKITDSAIPEVQQLHDVLKGVVDARSEGPEALNAAFDRLKNTTESLEQPLEDTFERLKNFITEDCKEGQKLENVLDKLYEALLKLGGQQSKVAISGHNYAQSIKNIEQAIDAVQGKMPKISERFVAFGSALSSFAMTLQSVNSIINTLENPDLSSWDKFLNITMSLGMIIPSVIRLWTQLNVVFKTQQGEIASLQAQKAILIAQENTEAASIYATTAAIKAKTAEEQVAIALENKHIAFQEAKHALALIEDKDRLNIITGLRNEFIARQANLTAMTDEEVAGELLQLLQEKNIVLSDEEKIALIKTTVARKAAIASEEAETAATELNEIATIANNKAKRDQVAVNELVDKTNKKVAASALLAKVALGAIVAILAVAAGAAFFYAKELEKGIEKQKKNAEEASNHAEDLRDEAEANRELLTSYEELLEQYKNGEIEKSEMYDATVELADAYDVEGAAIANLTGQYDELIAKIKEASAEKIKEQKQAEKSAYRENIRAMVGEGVTGTGRIAGADGGYIYKIGPNPPESHGRDDYGGGEALKEYLEWTQLIKDVTGKDNDGTLRIEDRSDPEQVIQYYEDLLKIKEKLETGKFERLDTETLLNQLDEEISQMKGYYTDAMENASTYNRLLIEETGNSLELINAKTKEEVEDIVNKIKDKLKNEGLNATDEEIDKLVNQYLQGLGTEAITKFLAGKELIAEGIKKEISDAFLDLDISDSSRELMMQIGFDIDRYETKEELEKAVKDFQTLIDADNNTAYISLPVSLNFNEKINKGKDITKNEWDELKEQVPNVEDILGDKDSFNNKSIAERLQLMSELNKVIAEQNKLVIDSLPEQRKAQEDRNKELEEEIKLQKERIETLQRTLDHSDSLPTDTVEKLKEEYKEADAELQDLLEDQERLNEYLQSMEDAGYAWLQTGINEVLTDAQSLQSAVELIGDAWIVAADNVDVFAQMFPDLVEQAEHLEDGTLRLNKALVAETLNGNAEIMKSNKEVIVQQIDDKLVQLRAEEKFLQDKSKILEATLKGQISETQAETKIIETYNNYKSDLEKDGVKNHATAASQATNITASMSNNLVDSLNTVNKAVQTLNDNISKIGTGEKLTDINVGSAGGTSITGDISGITKPNGMKETDYSAIVQDLNDTTQRLSTVQKEISSLEGSRAKILEGLTNYTAAVDRVNAGKAGKAEKETKGAKRSKPDTKDLVDIDKELDRYYDINNAISKINQELEKQEQLEKKLSTYQEHYAGKTLIKSLQKQNDLLREKNGILDKQYENYQKLYEIQSQELGELKGKIGGNWNGNELQNYAELFQANVDKYNAVISAYNAMTKEQQDASGKQMVEDAKKAYDAYKDALDRYQTLYYNEMYDTENKLAEYRQQQLENQFKIIENNLKAWETEIQLKLDMTGLKRDWKAFMKDVETDFRKIYKNLTKASGFDVDIFGTHIEDAETRIKQIEDVEAEIRKMEASKDANGAVQITDDMMFGSISEAQEKLKELQKELVDVGNSLNDMYKQVWDNYIDGLEQAKDNFEDINNEIEHLTKELEYEKELIELIYGDKAYELMDKYYTTQQKNIENQIGSIRQQAQFWEEQFEKAFEMNKDKHNVNKDDMSTWTEDMRKAYDNMIEAQEKLNDLVIEGIKNLKDEYLNNVAKTMSEMDKAMWGMDFDKVKEDWDFIQKRADEYLDDVEGAYKIQTLQNKINKSIAETTDLKAQQKLAKLREDEMKMLREKERLTQDDIDLAEARYQIALKEIALEDAQNSKTSMKLSRDTSGNWTYQYVADEEDTQNKQQELLDAYANLYETADNAYNHAMELAMQMYEEYQEKFRQISEDTTLSEEEKYQKLMELQELYLPEIEAAFENSQLYQQETIYATAGVFAEVCEQDETAYNTLTDAQQALVDAVRDHHLEDYEEIRAAIVDEVYPELKQAAEDTFLETNENSHTAAAQVIDDWDKGGDSVKAALNDAFKAVIGYTKDFEKELELLEQISGKTITDPNGVVSDIEAIGNKMDEAANKTDEMADRATSDLDMLRDYVNEVESAWESMISRIEEAINALQEYLQATEEAIDAQRELAQAAAEARAAGADSPSISGGGSGESGGGGGSGGSGGGVAGEERNRSYQIVYVSEPHYRGSTDTFAISVRSSSGATREIDLGKNPDPNHNSQYKRYLEYPSVNWDTGGYTGDWGSSDDTIGSKAGKLAVLHQKELILNASDTQNMLEAVNIIRDIAGLNESINQTIANSIGKLIANAIAGGSASTSSENNANNTFNITAEFPNANDVQTIRDAILSLPNIASQYIHTN